VNGHRVSAATRQDRARDTILRDGASIRVRDAVPEDEPGLVAFLEGLDVESRRLRFASVGTDLEARAHRWAVPERPGDCSLVAVTGIDDRIIGNGSYDRLGADAAEVAFVVADEFQGRGVATLLLEELARRAHEAGISTFVAEVLPENARMLDVFRTSGFALRVRSEPGSIVVELPTELSGEARERFERREQSAAAAAVRALLHPTAVAVIGASRRRGTVGGELFHNLLSSGFPGPVYPVNPNADVVQSVAAYRSIGDIPGPVDLAVIVSPAASVVDVARACATKGVKSVVVVSPGFAETGAEGLERQRELVAVCRGAGMRLVGPNCMGIINLEPEARLNATFSPTLPMDGRVGFLSQSGALGLAIIEHANRLGLGLSSFISIGNKADMSGNDFLQYWEADDRCAVIALYLESVGNPRKFSRIARRVGRTKPIIVVKSGRSAAGARATSSHTGVLIGASDVTVDALFHQAGVVRTDTLAEFFDVASLLANQPLPAGRNVAILTNGGGPGILAADACEGDGLTVPPLPDEVRRQLAGFLPPEASLLNPVDTIDASPETFRRAITTLGAWDGIDALIVLFVPPLGTEVEDVAEAIKEAASELPREIPVIAVFMATHGEPAALCRPDCRVPVYAYPEEAARALAHAAGYAAWRAAPVGSPARFDDVRSDEASGILAAAMTELGGQARDGGETTSGVASDGVAMGDVAGDDRSRWLRPDEVARVLHCYGIGTADAARDHRPSEPGVEMLVGVVHDRLFGPVIACGAGGSSLGRRRDVAVRITPLTDRDADEMIRSLAMLPVLDGGPDTPPMDLAALQALLLRVSAMVEAHPEIVEMDCNPVLVRREGVIVVEARMRIEAPRPRT
jgi:acetyl coenzyme A synthetase (ADP forming)-like protein